MLEKIPGQHSYYINVHLVSFCSTRELPLFYSASSMLSLFLSSILLPSSISPIFPSQASSTRESPPQHEAVSTETKKQRYKRQEVSGMHTPFGSALDLILDKIPDQMLV